MRDRPDRIPFLRGYRGKVWYIAGDKDQLIPMESVMEQVALLGSKAGVEVLRDTGHMGLIEKEEDIFQAMLRLMTLL